MLAKYPAMRLSASCENGGRISFSPMVVWTAGSHASHQCHCSRRDLRAGRLLYHESDLRIEEHYTDTAGFTDHVFALMHLLGYRFAPRIRDLADRRLYVPDCRK